uniref:Uncharacterized protein n=1 Tax=Aplanochytrium stocchinoi TaxID=215587 RepID=A0A7S3PJM6_9STRA
MAEAKVSPEVWREIRREQNRFHQKEMANLTVAASVVQKAFRKWKQGKWERIFNRTDNEYKILCETERKETNLERERTEKLQILHIMENVSDDSDSLTSPENDLKHSQSDCDSGIGADSLSKNSETIISSNLGELSTASIGEIETFINTNDISSHYKVLRDHNPNLFDVIPEFMFKSQYEEKTIELNVLNKEKGERNQSLAKNNNNNIVVYRGNDAYDYRKVRPKSAIGSSITTSKSNSILPNSRKRPQSCRTRVRTHPENQTSQLVPSRTGSYRKMGAHKQKSSLHLLKPTQKDGAYLFTKMSRDTTLRPLSSMPRLQSIRKIPTELLSESMYIKAKPLHSLGS